MKGSSFQLGKDKKAEKNHRGTRKNPAEGKKGKMEKRGGLGPGGKNTLKRCRKLTIQREEKGVPRRL